MASVVGTKSIRLKSATSHHRIFCASKPAKSPLSTAARPLKQARPCTSRVSTAAQTLPARHLAPSAAITRHASSSATAPPDPNQNSNTEELLTWDRFLDLRRKRRYLNLASSMVTASATIGILGPVIAQQDIDGWAAQISGIDPIYVLGITTFAVATGGWLCGPSFGSAIFKVWAGRKGWNQAIAEKEKSFYARVKRYRADPSSSSIQNPIPDYYGEKIASVKDYRRWLKDQRAFNLKKNKNMI